MLSQRTWMPRNVQRRIELGLAPNIKKEVNPVRLSRPARSMIRIGPDTLPSLRAGVTSDGEVLVRFLGVKR